MPYKADAIPHASLWPGTALQTHPALISPTGSLGGLARLLKVSFNNRNFYRNTRPSPRLLSREADSIYVYHPGPFSQEALSHHSFPGARALHPTAALLQAAQILVDWASCSYLGSSLSSFPWELSSSVPLERLSLGASSS